MTLTTKPSPSGWHYVIEGLISLKTYRTSIAARAAGNLKRKALMRMKA